MNELWNTLKKHAVRLKERSLRELCTDKNRFETCSVQLDQMLLDFTKEKIDHPAMQDLQKLIASCRVEEKRERLFAGEKINTTEQRRVLHMALRRWY